MNNLQAWIDTTPYKGYTLSVASADASFRSYYRLKSAHDSFILMDSSLEKESLPPFLDITQRLLNAAVKAPHILEQNIELGYLILEDFGDTHLLKILHENNFKELYKKAIDEILKMQKANTSGLPLYDKEFLHFEMDLMQEWYLEQLLRLRLSQTQQKMLDQTLNSISDVVLSQPQGLFVHRDYHSRNIMLTTNTNIGVIDYQDAMNGTITYDLVSLLKDCYIFFDTKEIEKLALYFRDKKQIKVSDETFLKWFDFMGLQRHIKVLGVFSRLSLRDKKDVYLKDIPLTLEYVIQTALRYEETKALGEFLQEVTQ